MAVRISWNWCRASQGVSSRYEARHHRADRADLEGRAGGGSHRDPARAVWRMVGTFYQSPEPAAQPYVKVGSRVTVGQVVCIIEAMKIMNEIESEVTGVIRDVAAQNAQPVEFGQVLFRVDPHG